MYKLVNLYNEDLSFRNILIWLKYSIYIKGTLICLKCPNWRKVQLYCVILASTCIFSCHNSLVLVDDVIPDMLSWQQLITSDITHYELSKTKTAFTNRLALHYPAIHRYTCTCMYMYIHVMLCCCDVSVVL